MLALGELADPVTVMVVDVEVMVVDVDVDSWRTMVVDGSDGDVLTEFPGAIDITSDEGGMMEIDAAEVEDVGVIRIEREVEENIYGWRVVEKGEILGGAVNAAWSAAAFTIPDARVGKGTSCLLSTL